MKKIYFTLLLIVTFILIYSINILSSNNNEKILIKIETFANNDTYFSFEGVVDEKYFNKNNEKSINEFIKCNLNENDTRKISIDNKNVSNFFRIKNGYYAVSIKSSRVQSIEAINNFYLTGDSNYQHFYFMTSQQENTIQDFYIISSKKSILQSIHNVAEFNEISENNIITYLKNEIFNYFDSNNKILKELIKFEFQDDVTKYEEYKKYFKENFVFNIYSIKINNKMIYIINCLEKTENHGYRFMALFFKKNNLVIEINEKFDQAFMINKTNYIVTSGGLPATSAMWSSIYQLSEDESNLIYYYSGFSF